MARFNVISAKNNYGQEVIIRTIDRDGVTWYVVSDFCKGIDFPNTYSTKAYMSPENMDLLYANNKSYIIATYDGLKEMDGKFRNKRTVDHYKLLMQQISDKTRPIDPKRLEARFLAHAADFGAKQDAKMAPSANPTVKTTKLQLWDKNLIKQCYIRSIKKNGETWLFASDVCELIDYKNPSGLRVFFSPENYDKQEIDGKERLLINYAGMKQLKGRLSKKKTAAAYNVLMWNLEKYVFSHKKDETETDVKNQQSTPQAKEEDVTKHIKDNDESIGDILSTLINCCELLIDALKTIKAKRGEI